MSRYIDAKKKKFRWLKTLCITVAVLFICFFSAIYVFFHTSLFQNAKELWVETAMSTMNHQWLATMFLSDEEIQEILNKLAVENKENSDPEQVTTSKKEVEKEKFSVTVKEISGKNYVGHVMIINDPAAIHLVDTRKTSTGTRLHDIMTEFDALAGINAGGFQDIGGHGKGNIIKRAAIFNSELENGSMGYRYSFIGWDDNKDKLVLGNYTYAEAIAAGITDAVEFGPFLVVNGNPQIGQYNSGGIHPRTAIGQRKDGTMVFVVIDGRQPGYSLGTTLKTLQDILIEYDVYNGANLDGGASSTMYYKGECVNKPSSSAGERYLPNAFIVLDQ